MPKRMLIDATHSEETRVAVVDQNLRLEHLDIVHAGREPLKGNIYLAKVKRIEPSLQAAFVEYDENGEKRHGFLSFAEIHPDYFRIPVADRERLRDALARIEAKAVEAAARGEEVSLESLTSGDEELMSFVPVTMLEGDLEDELHDHDDEHSHAHGHAHDGHDHHHHDDEPVARDPFQPIDIDAVSADPFQPISLDDNGAFIAPEAGENGEEAAAPAPQKPTYETLGDDDLEERRRRIRRQFLRNYRIQEVIKRGQVMLIQVVKEERGNKGAALTTYLSLAGRYCVLMPNSDKSGGVSRKISNPGDRKRLKETLENLNLPEGMSVILRTAGVERSSDEIKRDFDYLVRLWEQIREQTLQSTAPCLIYEEANLIKRAIRDHYTRDMDGVVVEGEHSYRLAQDFMKLLMPSHVSRVVRYEHPIPLFTRYQVEKQIDLLYEPVVQLKSGGYLVINPTEALVSIDVNSGRATRDRHIEETALRTNLEAAEEVARQLRLRDLAGLVVIDFIDMEDYRHNNAVERKLKESMKQDRARIQIGRISGFGLMEMSRQRLRQSLLETNFEKCPHCAGTGHIRSADSAALSVLRAIEDEGIKQKASEIVVDVPTDVALYIMNEKRDVLSEIENRYSFRVYLRNDEELLRHEFNVERLENRTGEPAIRIPSTDTRRVFAETATELGLQPLSAEELAEVPSEDAAGDEEAGEGRRGRNGRRGRSGRSRNGRNEKDTAADSDEAEDMADDGDDSVEDGAEQAEGAAGDEQRGDRRRRGRRGGRRRGRERSNDNGETVAEDAGSDSEAVEGDDAEVAAEGSEGGEQRPRNNRRRRGGRNRNGRERSPETSGDATISQPVFASSPTVLEIDTTPKAYVPVTDKQVQRVDVHSADGDTLPEGATLNQAPDGPKAGWWRRWTGN